LYRSLGKSLTKAHDWAVDQLTDLFRTTHKVKTQQVVQSRGQHCGDVELTGYLANASDPVLLVLDLRIAHDRFGSSSDPNLNGKLHWPNDIDKSLRWRQNSHPARRKTQRGGQAAEGKEEQPPAAEGHHPGSSVEH